jgi:hypothetical protein
MQTTWQDGAGEIRGGVESVTTPPVTPPAVWSPDEWSPDEWSPQHWSPEYFGDLLPAKHPSGGAFWWQRDEVDIIDKSIDAVLAE